MDLRDLIEAAGCNARPIQLLNISGNLGRIPARMVPDLMYLFQELRDLNLYGCLLGSAQGPLLPCDALDALPSLQEIDISHYKVSPHHPPLPPTPSPRFKAYTHLELFTF